MNYYKERLELIEKICRLKSRVYANERCFEGARVLASIAYICAVGSLKYLENICREYEERLGNENIQ